MTPCGEVRQEGVLVSSSSSSTSSITTAAAVTMSTSCWSILVVVGESGVRSHWIAPLTMSTTTVDGSSSRCWLGRSGDAIRTPHTTTTTCRERYHHHCRRRRGMTPTTSQSRRRRSKGCSPVMMMMLLRNCNWLHSIRSAHPYLRLPILEDIQTKEYINALGDSTLDDGQGWTIHLYYYCCIFIVALAAVDGTAIMKSYYYFFFFFFPSSQEEIDMSGRDTSQYLTLSHAGGTPRIPSIH